MALEAVADFDFDFEAVEELAGLRVAVVFVLLVFRTVLVAEAIGAEAIGPGCRVFSAVGIGTEFAGGSSFITSDSPGLEGTPPPRFHFEGLSAQAST